MKSVKLKIGTPLCMSAIAKAENKEVFTFTDKETGLRIMGLIVDVKMANPGWVNFYIKE